MLRLLLAIMLLPLFYLCLYIWKTKHSRKMLQAFPSPPTLPILGNIHIIFGNGQDRVRKFLNIFKTYESPFVIWLSYLPIMILTKADDIQVVSSKCIDRDMMGIFEQSVGDGITVARAEKWKRTRRLINPAFAPSMLKQYLVVFNEQAKILVKKLEKESQRGKVFDLWLYMANANIDIITENITGSKLNTQENMSNEFSEALMTTLKLESLRFILPWLLSPTIYYLYRLFTGNKNLFRKLHKLPKQVLNTKKDDYKRFMAKRENLQENSPKSLMDILFRLHETNAEFTEKQMHNEMLNMIATGSESTAVTGSFVLLILAINQDIQEKVYQEVIQIFGSCDNVEMDNLTDLKYLEQCIKETLRIFTLFPITIRKTTDEIRLNDNRVIPANCQVGMALHGVHFDPTLYPKPRQWNPENFSDEAISNRPKHSFLAFGLGPRACIGSKYALMSLKTQIAHIVLNYHLSTNIKYSDLRPVMDAIVRNKFGYPVKLVARNMNSQNK